MSQVVSFLYGPTASGKTNWAVEWSQRTGGNLLSADARQIYRGMSSVVGKDILAGSAWQKADELPASWQMLHGAKIWGLDVVNPDEDFSLSHWYHWIAPIVTWHLVHNHPLLVVGGTWQWHQVVFAPPDSLFVPPDQAWREVAKGLSLEQLQQQLQTGDTEAWEKMNTSERSNRQRLIRRIEVLKQENTVHPTPTALIPETSPQIFVRDRSIDDLTAAIQSRVLDRWQHGALPETQKLMADYSDWSTPAFSASGYPIIRQYLEGELSEEDAIRLWTTSERSYAKRQRTWIQKIKLEQNSLLV